MALLGIYKDELGRGFSNLNAVHFNLWILEKKIPEILKDAMLFRGVSFYKYFVDVGLRLDANEEIVTKMDLHLPAAGLLTKTFFDLEEKVTRREHKRSHFWKKGRIKVLYHR
jgi:hypothetical protein